MDTAYWEKLSNLKKNTDATNAALIYNWYALLWTKSSDIWWQIRVLEITWDIILEKWVVINNEEIKDFKAIWDKRSHYIYWDNSAIVLDTAAFIWTVPDTKLALYTWLIVSIWDWVTTRSLFWWEITSITSSTWWTISGIEINSDWNIKFAFTTPNVWWTILTIKWKLLAWNTFSITKNISLPN